MVVPKGLDLLTANNFYAWIFWEHFFTTSSFQYRQSYLICIHGTLIRTNLFVIAVVAINFKFYSENFKYTFLSVPENRALPFKGRHSEDLV